MQLQGSKWLKVGGSGFKMAESGWEWVQKWLKVAGSGFKMAKSWWEWVQNGWWVGVDSKLKGLKWIRKGIWA